MSRWTKYIKSLIKVSLDHVGVLAANITQLHKILVLKLSKLVWNSFLYFLQLYC
jgi:hypothetical protein